MKLYLTILATITLSGCITNPNVQKTPDIITLVDRKVAYVPYPSCPAPNQITPRALPIAYLKETSTPNEIATAYVKSIAVLKSDLGAAISELNQYQKYHEESLASAAKIKESTLDLDTENNNETKFKLDAKTK